MDLWGMNSSPSLHLLPSFHLLHQRLLLLLGLLLLQGVPGLPSVEKNILPRGSYFISRTNYKDSKTFSVNLKPEPNNRAPSEINSENEDWKTRDGFRERLPSKSLRSPLAPPQDELLHSEISRNSRSKRDTPLSLGVNSFTELSGGTSALVESPTETCCGVSTWRITAADNVGQLSVEFTDFQVGDSSTMCPFYGRLVIQTDKTWEQYCGSELPPATQASRNVAVTYFGNFRTDNFRVLVTASEDAVNMNDTTIHMTTDTTTTIITHTTPDTTIANTTTDTITNTTTTTSTTIGNTSTSTEASLCVKCGTINRESAKGRDANRIIGGQDTEPHEYPFAVGFKWKSTGAHSCGGTLINKQYVLTAAHCLYLWGNGNMSAAKDHIDAVLGAHNYDNDTEARVTAELAKTIGHPRYDPANLVSDIGLAKLAQDAIFSKTIQPACLDRRNLQYAGETLTVIGWGVVDVSTNELASTLQEVDVTMISRDMCRNHYSTEMVKDDMICAHTEDKDSCQGDSGGPLFKVLDDGELYALVVGVVSWGEGCASKPGVYSSVGYYTNWVKNNIDGTGLCSR